MKPPKSLPVYRRILPTKRFSYTAWIRRSWNVTSTKHSFGLKRQQALRVQDKRTIPKTSSLSCFRAIASSGPVIIRTHAPPSSVSSTKSRLGVFSARRRFSHRDFILPSRMPGSATNRMRTSRRGEALPSYENDALLKPIAEAFRARALAQLGEVDAAIDALPHLLEVPGGIHPGELRYSPYWDPLRKDPRFEALLKNPPPVRY